MHDRASWGAWKFRPGRRSSANLSQEIFVPETAQFEFGGKSVGELNDARVEEGETPFDGMGHGYTIALRRKQVSTQERDDLQVLRSAEQVPPPEVFGELHGIKDGSSLSTYLIRRSRLKRTGEFGGYYASEWRGNSPALLLRSVDRRKTS